MNKWIKEEWSFRVEVTDSYAKDCRLGFEKVMLSDEILRNYRQR